MEYFKLENIIEKLNVIRENGITKGLSCGMSNLDELFTLKKGFPLFIAGSPGAGKTEFTLEILLNTSILYRWKHFIYIGEGGDVENVFAELIHKYIGKPYYQSNPYAMSNKERMEAEYFINEHFVIANHDKDFTIDEFYKLVELVEREQGIKFDSTVFDPFNDIKDEIDTFGGREDKYLASALKKVRISSKKNNRIDILVNHVADVRAIIDKEGNRFMPPASPNEWAGGRTWWRRAFTMLLIYRPYTFLKDKNGMPYAENETHVICQKSKPKGVGKLGTKSIFFDWKKNRYYYFTDGNQKLYSCELPPVCETKSLVPSKEFDVIINDTNPF